jgi:hypothetical protein
MTQPFPKCSPDCSTYRIEIDRPYDYGQWTRAELLAEVRKLALEAKKFDDRETAALRREHLVRKRLKTIPRWVRWLFGGRS